jgi:HEAT repeat protein
MIDAVTVAEGVPMAYLEALGLRRDDLRRDALEALSAAGFVVRTSGDRSSSPHYSASASILDARPVRRTLPDGPPESEELRMEVAVELRLEPVRSDEGSLREAARWSEPVRPGESDLAALRRALAGATRRAAANLVLGIAEAGKPDRAVIADLDSADSRVRDHAVRILADRKNPVAVPALIARLRDPDPELVERAVGALDQIKDPRAVEPLIELSHRREGPFVAQLARIIGDIGGPEADAYLLTLASGHPEPMVRNAAEQALAQSRERRTAVDKDAGRPR